MCPASHLGRVGNRDGDEHRLDRGLDKVVGIIRADIMRTQSRDLGSKYHIQHALSRRKRMCLKKRNNSALRLSFISQITSSQIPPKSSRRRMDVRQNKERIYLLWKDIAKAKKERRERREKNKKAIRGSQVPSSQIPVFLQCLVFILHPIKSHRNTRTERKGGNRDRNRNKSLYR